MSLCRAAMEGGCSIAAAVNEQQQTAREQATAQQQRSRAAAVAWMCLLTFSSSHLHPHAHHIQSVRVVCSCKNRCRRFLVPQNNCARSEAKKVKCALSESLCVRVIPCLMKGCDTRVHETQCDRQTNPLCMHAGAAAETSIERGSRR